MKILSVSLIGIGILLILTTHLTNAINKSTIEDFNNGEILVCYKTLIITNSNWKLSDNNLINNNSAGYVDIENCEKRK